MSRDSTSGLKPERLARLLGIALDADSEGSKNISARTTAELLNAHLNGQLPLDTTAVEALPVILGRLQKDLVLQEGKTLGEVLMDPESELNAIKRIREHGKKMAARKGKGAERAVAVAIYYAAIANALLFHKAKITTHSYELLEASFAKLREKPWMCSELAELFAKACKVCSQ